MEGIPYDVLIAIVGGMVEPIIDEARPILRKALRGTEERQALQRSLTAGLAALFMRATAALPDDAATRDHLVALFKTYLSDEEVLYELAAPLRAKNVDIATLGTRLADMGLDTATLPGLSLPEALRAFESGFTIAALEESVLQPLIQTSHTVLQSGVQSEILAVLREFVTAWREAQPRGAAIRAGGIVVNDGTGTVLYQLPGSTIAAPRGEAHYLRSLIARCDPLDLAPFDEGQSLDLATAPRVHISEVYTTLNVAQVLHAPDPLFYRDSLTRRPQQSVTEALERRGERDEMEALQVRDPQRRAIRSTKENESSNKEAIAVSAIEALAAMPRSVVLGVPGGGKSTLVNHVAVQLARRRLGEPVTAERLPGWAADARPLPVRIVLRHFAEWLRHRDTLGEAGDVWAWLQYQLETRWGCGDAFEWVRQTLQGEGGIIFFDGLDEVPEGVDERQRSRIIRAVAEFARPLTECRVVVTCREYAYRPGSPWRLPEAEWRVLPLALFDMEQVRSFSETWYRVVGPQKGWDAAKVVDEATALARAVEAQPHLRELAYYPLLLTLMAQVHGQDGTLPNDRADLYRRAVTLLLSQWENRLVRDREGLRREPGLIQQLGVTSELLQNALEQVAYEAHLRQESEEGRDDRAADIPQWELLKSLKKGLGSLDRAEQAVAYIQERAGLLQARGDEVFTFPHRTFQEYLAALFALKDGEYDNLLAKAVRRDLVWWREVFLMAAGASRKHPRVVSDMVDALLRRAPAVGDPVSEDALERARLGEQALHETSFLPHVTPEQERYQSTAERVRGWLEASLVAGTSLPPTARAAAGVALARLGDKRDEAMTVAGMALCYVPAGPLVMGGLLEYDPEVYSLKADGLDYPRHEYDIPYGYWIGKYPVTNAQYAEFVNAGGYGESEFWPEAREVGFWKNGSTVREYDLFDQNLRGIEAQDLPRDYRVPFNLPNHPVVGVTWYEALAFTRWLTTQADGAWTVVLPLEPEWDKAARGGLKLPDKPLVRTWEEVHARRVLKTLRICIPNPLPTRRYPWGGVLEPNRANYDETRIDTTSPVGSFPLGASPYGAEEMIGNTWEWSRSMWGAYSYPPRCQSQAERKVSTLIEPQKVIVRGGSFFLSRSHVRMVVRTGMTPTSTLHDTSFRVVVRSASSSSS